MYIFTELEERLAAAQSMYDSTFKESSIDDKYGKPKMPSSTPKKSQTLKETVTISGELNIYLFLVFEFEMLSLNI